MNRRGARRIAAMAVIPIVLAACGSSSKKAATSPTTVSSGASATTASAGAYGYGGGSATTTAGTTGTTTAGASGGTVKIATVPKVGKVLVAADGRTLSLFEKDHGTTSACSAAQCMGAWPPYTSMTTPTAGTGLTATKLTTANGAVAHQVVYNGHLLYLFSGDKKAGDANGVGIPSWYPVTPQGSSME